MSRAWRGNSASISVRPDGVSVTDTMRRSRGERVRHTSPRASSLSTTSVMLPALVSTLRPSSRWVSGPLCRIASSTPSWVGVSPAAASRGSTRASTALPARSSFT